MDSLAIHAKLNFLFHTWSLLELYQGATIFQAEQSKGTRDPDMVRLGSITI